MNKRKYVQYGCGLSAPVGWENYDVSPTLRFERIPLIGKLYTKNEFRFPNNVKYGDIVKGLPVDQESCNGVYCSHVLEHLSLSDFKIALKNTYKMLRPGGKFRLVLPDLEYLVNQYINSFSDDAALTFMRETYLGYETWDRNICGFVTSWIGNSKHRWMWDYKSIKPELQRAGFVGIRRASFNDSSDPIFKEVEDSNSWKNCLGLECKKLG